MKIKNQVVVALITRLAFFVLASVFIIDGVSGIYGSDAGYIATGGLILLAMRKS